MRDNTHTWKNMDALHEEIIQYCYYNHHPIHENYLKSRVHSLQSCFKISPLNTIHIPSNVVFADEESLLIQKSNIQQSADLLGLQKESFDFKTDEAKNVN
jgi:hypothetical protein